jgi:hypothetical protein
MKARLAQSNWIRGLRGVVWCRCVPNFVYVAYRVNELIEDANNELPDALLQFIARLIGRSSGGGGWDGEKWAAYPLTERLRVWSR